jgi:hypothetical protein
MTSKLAQISTSLFVQRRPLTNIALDNKIRAMLSQLHPHERHFASISHKNSYIRSINSIEKECLKSKLSSMMNKQSDEYIYTFKKVTKWLEDFDHGCKKK